ncbi:endonuclease/exonuclease/phosphatase family protein [Salipiger mucosus]|uniref:Metal-dependent hydrolase n=1 Tax=Salipiger mucosus DSM 16094 TaxID=1123237 RepID=S9SI89_9RHOB|nr:endonuclease/exonuclease/phosphatase family protein [Salipiger mucosus]EPX86049.1 Metal-dependent hydrolase [Salipiger mucosus DSM 16094]
MRIASYNIRKAVGIDRRRDPARILSVLNSLGADVAVLQEADRRLGPRPSALPRFLIEQETDYVVADLAATDVSLGFHGNAVLVRRDLAVRETRHLELPGLEPRGAVMVRLDGLTVVGTHLGLMRRWRLRQMLAIRAHLGGDEAHTVIAGDLNEWSDRHGYEPWEEAYRILLPGRSYHAARPFVALDGFALGSGLAVTGSGVHRGGAARRASDHLPVWAEIAGVPGVPEG